MDSGFDKDILQQMKASYTTTEGEYLLEYFDAGESEEINMIKSVTAGLIDYVRDNGKDPRCTQIAITEFEGAAMWAVKSVTKKPRT